MIIQERTQRKELVEERRDRETGGEIEETGRGIQRSIGMVLSKGTESWSIQIYSKTKQMKLWNIISLELRELIESTNCIKKSKNSQLGSKASHPEMRFGTLVLSIESQSEVACKNRS